MPATATPPAPASTATDAVSFEGLSEALREVAEARVTALRGTLAAEHRVRDGLHRVAATAAALADTDAE